VTKKAEYLPRERKILFRLNFSDVDLLQGQLTTDTDRTR